MGKDRDIFKQILTESEDAVAIFNTKLEYTFANKSWLSLFSLDEDSTKEGSKFASSLEKTDYLPDIEKDILLALSGKTIVRNKIKKKTDLETLNFKLQALPHTSQSETGEPDSATIIISKTQTLFDSICSDESFLMQFVNSADLIIAVLDKEKNILIINDAGCRLLGYKREELTGKNWVSLIIAENDKKKASLIYKAMFEENAEAYSRTQCDVVTAYGVIRPIVWNNDILVDEDGETAAILCSGEDVTEKQMAEQALKKQEEQYQRLSESIKDIFFSVDQQLHVLYWNEACEEKTGISAEQIKGKPLFDYLPELEGDSTKKALRKTVERQVTAQSVAVIKINNKELVFDLSIYPIDKGASILAKDITIQVRFQEQLFEQAQVLDQLQEAVITTDRSGIIQTANRPCLSIYGKSLTDMKGAHISSIFQMDDRKRFNSLLDEITRYPSYASDEFHILHGDGKLFYALVHITLKKGLDGAENGFILSIIDISETVTIRRELLKVNRSLEESIVKRTAELEKSKHRAEAANLAKTNFLANMGHEVRTPMNAIIGSTHMLAQGELPQEKQKYINQITESSNRLLRIIDNILDYSKLESGTFELQTIEFNLESTLSSLRSEYIEAFSSKNITVSFIIERDVPLSLLGDSIRIKQIFSIILHNAVKFTEKGNVTFSVAKKKESINTIILEFCIADTGIGIEKSALSKIFTPFSQGDESRSRKYEGVGMGLALCKRVIERIGGSIYIESQISVGTKVFVNLPFENRAPSQITDPKTNFVTKTLVICSHDDTKKELQTILERSQHACHFAGSIESALAFFSTGESSETFSSIIVCSDTVNDSSQELLKLKQLSKSPLILVHSNTFIPIQSSLREVVGDMVIEKPLTDSLLMGEIKRLQSLFLEQSDEESIESGFEDISILLISNESDECQETKTQLAQLNIPIDHVYYSADIPKAIQSTAYDAILLDIKLPYMEGLISAKKIRAIPAYAKTPIIAITYSNSSKEIEQLINAGINDYIKKPFDGKLFLETLKKLIINNEKYLSASAAQEKTVKPIKGINLNSLLQKVEGNEKAIKELFSLFAKNNKESITTLKELYRKKEMKDLKQALHKLQGSAANIGAEKLSKAIKTFQESDPESQEASFAFADICFQLDITINSITLYIESAQNDESNDKSSVESKESVEELYEKLEEKLDASETDSIVVIEQLLNLEHDTKLKQHLRDLKEICQTFDFDRAKTFLSTFYT